MFLRSLVCEIGFGMWRTIYRAASAFVPTSSEPAARMPLLHAKEVAEKVGNRLPYGRGSESARRVYSYLLSRDRQGAVVLVLFQQPLLACSSGIRAAGSDRRGIASRRFIDRMVDRESAKAGFPGLGSRRLSKDLRTPEITHARAGRSGLGLGCLLKLLRGYIAQRRMQPR